MIHTNNLLIMLYLDSFKSHPFFEVLNEYKRWVLNGSAKEFSFTDIDFPPRLYITLRYKNLWKVCKPYGMP